MVNTSPGYAITVRVDLLPDASATSGLTQAIISEGAALTALDVVDSNHQVLTVDVTCNTRDSEHAKAVTQAISLLPDAQVRKVSDRTFLLHLGGKLEVRPKVPLKTRDDLSRAYTPGVARVCLAIAEDPTDARRLTIKRNTVAVVTDGSAVLGLGNIGALAAMPVMEGKAALFKRFANIDAWPVCLDTQDVDEIVRTVQIIAPAYGGINLEDISAPRCFEIEQRLRELLDIPVFHDDQHGTSIVVLAALTNALKLVEKSISDLRIVISGAGAAGTAIAQLLVASGARNIVAYDSKGAIYLGRPDSERTSKWMLENTNESGISGSLADGLVGADVFIGVSAPNLLTEQDISTMADKSIVFALSNPDPEIDPILASKHAAIVATGRSDYPNQINNVLAFPGIFRGLLDSGASQITEEILVAAAKAIASCVTDAQLNSSFIVPSVFDSNVAPAVAAAVQSVAKRS
ncbi:MAG: NAD-dependent malic enzyme [Actinobacteria bacterium]|nr:NAD-dependent malic enzyme [Actinomycetota bacterium]NBY15811.1 NAD-dependent malic enzyme [Actinomycetota bacterium]